MMARHSGEGQQESREQDGRAGPTWVAGRTFERRNDLALKWWKGCEQTKHGGKRHVICAENRNGIQWKESDSTSMEWGLHDGFWFTCSSPSTLGSKFYEGRHSAGHGECSLKERIVSWGIHTVNKESKDNCIFCKLQKAWQSKRAGCHGKRTQNGPGRAPCQARDNTVEECFRLRT